MQRSGMVAFLDEASVPAALAAAQQGQIVEVEEVDEDAGPGPGSTLSNEASGLRGEHHSQCAEHACC